MVGLFFLMVQAAVGSLLTGFVTRVSIRLFRKEMPAFEVVYKACFIAMVAGTLAPLYFMNQDDIEQAPLKGAALYLLLLWCTHAVVLKVFLGLKNLEAIALSLVPVLVWMVIFIGLAAAMALGSIVMN